MNHLLIDSIEMSKSHFTVTSVEEALLTGMKSAEWQNDENYDGPFFNDPSSENRIIPGIVVLYSENVMRSCFLRRTMARHH
ncbi:hypothetical protein NPIL_393841 [Nephila pilipes]|uniref:Uncharacterized protein n=1 Tax=Nephila pilipes TaxID=299642 RepID=A0A8X6QLB7_NEPPI|nr:hypothetical protein NPIL_393841 [Nephila pilipes]